MHRLPFCCPSLEAASFVHLARLGRLAWAKAQLGMSRRAYHEAYVTSDWRDNQTKSCEIESNKKGDTFHTKGDIFCAFGLKRRLFPCFLLPKSSRISLEFTGILVEIVRILPTILTTSMRLVTSVTCAQMRTKDRRPFRLASTREVSVTL